MVARAREAVNILTKLFSVTAQHKPLGRQFDEPDWLRMSEVQTDPPSKARDANCVQQPCWASSTIKRNLTLLSFRPVRVFVRTSHAIVEMGALYFQKSRYDFAR